MFIQWLCHHIAYAATQGNFSLVEFREHALIQGVKNIGRWTQFCDPLKKKNGMNSLEGIS